MSSLNAKWAPLYGTACPLVEIYASQRYPADDDGRSAVVYDFDKTDEEIGLLSRWKLSRAASPLVHWLSVICASLTHL